MIDGGLPALAAGEDAPGARDERGEPGREPVLEPTALPDVAWISRRDGTRAAGDLEDQDARYPHPATS